jgi:hypothetical protein
MVSTEAALHARVLNQRTRHTLPPRSEEPGAFFCECSNVRCYVTVWLTADRYDEVVAAAGFVLADGHEPPELDHDLRAQLQRLLHRSSFDS